MINEWESDGLFLFFKTLPVHWFAKSLRADTRLLLVVLIVKLQVFPRKFLDIFVNEPTWPWQQIKVQMFSKESINPN
jgi:hypothetical protein